MRKSDVGSELIQGMENAVAHARGKKRAAREIIVPVHIAARVYFAPS